MQATVDFLKLPVGLSTGQYPLLTSIDQNLSSYILKSEVLNVRKDLYQILKVADFDNSEVCNMVRIRGYGLYWVTARDTSTDVNGSVSFALSACAPSSMLFSGNAVDGEFSRLPENACPWLKRQARTGDILPTRSVDLPMMGVNDRGNLKVWIQVT